MIIFLWFCSLFSNNADKLYFLSCIWSFLRYQIINLWVCVWSILKFEDTANEFFCRGGLCLYAQHTHSLLTAKLWRSRSGDRLLHRSWFWSIKMPFYSLFQIFFYARSILHLSPKSWISLKVISTTSKSSSKPWPSFQVVANGRLILSSPAMWILRILSTIH